MIQQIILNGKMLLLRSQLNFYDPVREKYHHAVLVCGSKTFTFALAPSSRADLGRCKASDWPLPAPRPEQTLLCQIVERNSPVFVEHLAEAGKPFPGRARQEIWGQYKSPGGRD